ncbi:MAG: MlaC/ttg2D family ABC transporter substrate-binding protein [Candidatus Anammoxibacter sp.]
MKKFFCLLSLLLIFALSQIAIANVNVNHEVAEKEVKAAVSKALEVLSDKELTIEEKQVKVINITNAIFNFPLMAKLSLGKKHWMEFSPAQRAEFTSNFVELIQYLYTSKLGMFSNEKVIYEPAVVVSEKKIQIPTAVLSKGKKFMVVYKMSITEKGWKVYDVAIEGVSIVQTYRAQYRTVLKNSTVKELLTKMKEINIENKNKTLHLKTPSKT